MKTRLELFVAFCFFGFPLTSVAISQEPTKTLSPHPRLLLDRAGVERLKTRIAEQPWARTAWDAIQKSAVQALTDKVELPPRGGAYYHFYVDPEKGSPLHRGAEIGKWKWEHRTADGRTFRGDPADPKRDYDGYACLEIHLQWTKRCRNLGLAFQVTGDARYAQQAREILLAYADLYLTLSRRNHWGWPFPNSGRIATHMLSEALWLIPLVQGADLIWETLMPADRTKIADKIFRPCVETILIPQDSGLHNRQCWKNSAVGLVGWLLDDKKLIAEALDNSAVGHRALIKNGISDSGAWAEGSWSYHSYALQAMTPLLEAARHCGVDLYDDRLKKLFAAPFQLSAPSGALPAFNDGYEGNLSQFAGLSELAFARFRNPLFLKLLDVKKRHGEEALFYGDTDLPASDPTAENRRSQNFAESGYAMLTQGTGRDATWLCLKYGPHGGGHGHPDKGSFVLYARGRQLAIDPGMTLYGAPVHQSWYCTTLAHNTLIVNERSQVPATGKSLAFGNREGVDFVMLDAGPIYSGVRWVRSAALLDPQHLVFIDQVFSDTEATFDLAYHQAGNWSNQPPGTTFKPAEVDGFRHLTDATQRTLETGGELTLAVDKNWNTRLILASGQPTTIITATGIGSQPQQKVPVVLLRRKAKQTTFVWGLSLDDTPMQLETVRNRAIKVSRPGLPTLLLLADPENRELPFDVQKVDGER